VVQVTMSTTLWINGQDLVNRLLRELEREANPRVGLVI
jgi:hypothetical protein